MASPSGKDGCPVVLSIEIAFPRSAPLASKDCTRVLFPALKTMVALSIPPDWKWMFFTWPDAAFSRKSIWDAAASLPMLRLRPTLLVWLGTPGIFTCARGGVRECACDGPADDTKTTPRTRDGDISDDLHPDHGHS